MSHLASLFIFYKNYCCPNDSGHQIVQQANVQGSMGTCQRQSGKNEVQRQTKAEGRLQTEMNEDHSINYDSIVILFIIMESRGAIEEAKKDFQTLIREGELPPKMQVKLRYLMNAIQGNEEDYTLVDELPEFQKMSLQMMDKSTKVSLFNSIVKCLAGRQVLIYFSAEKATLKTESSSASSLTCYLFGSSQALKISKNKEGTSLYYEMSMEKLMVSKIYRQQKKKYSFGIEYEGVRYRVRFEEEGKCARIHGDLLTIIRQKRSLKSKQMQREDEPEIRKEEAEDECEINYEEKMIEEERQFLLSLKRKVGEANLQSTQRFQLVRNTDWGKILVNRKQNQVKILMFLQICDISNLIQSYIQFGAWNTQVESFRVLNKIRRNTYLCSLLLQRKAFTASRQAYFTVSYFKDCGCLAQGKSQSRSEGSQQKREKHYLILQSVDAPEYLKDIKGAYQFKLNQILQFSKVEGENSCAFINLKSNIDFNVYEYFNSSVDKTLDFLAEIGSITLLSRQRDLLRSNKKELFQFGHCICQLKVPDKSLILQKEQSQMNSEMKRSVTSDLQLSRKRVGEDVGVEWQLKDISEVLDNHNNKLLIEKRILELMKKKIYEKYYLKERFDLSCHEEPYIASQYRLKEIQNFFQLGSSWKFSSSEDLIFIDEEIIKMQKGALKLIIKQITSNLMAGKSILSMSLPVELFSDDSALEGFAKILGFVPPFMAEAVKRTEVVEQIKYVAAAWFFVFACNPQVTKPFNPILGETYQGIVGGIPVYFQQISHHPPIASFYMKNDKFEAYGNFDIIVDLGMNSAFTKFPTCFTVKIFENNTEYSIRYPDVEVGGIMFGDRVLKMVGKSYVVEKKSGIYLQLSVGKAKKGLYEYKQKIRQADLVGGIFQISPATIERLQSIEKKKSVEGIKPEEALKKYSTVTGKWYGDLTFDGVSIKSFKNGPFPLQVERPSILLPSDSTYRLEIIYKRWRDYKTSNEQKQVLENLQRKDRKAREKNHPKKH